MPDGRSLPQTNLPPAGQADRSYQKLSRPSCKGEPMYCPRSKCSAFPVQRGAHFAALLLLASIEVHCTSLEAHCTSLEVYCTSCEVQCNMHCMYTAVHFSSSAGNCSILAAMHCRIHEVHVKCCTSLHFAALQIDWKCAAVWSGVDEKAVT